MGTPAFSKIWITFSTKKGAQDSYKLLKNFDKECKKRWGKECDTDIYGLDYDGKSLSCEVHSGRSQNCEWQVERVAILVSEVAKVTSFESDMFIMGDGYYFTEDSCDESFEEFVEPFKTRE